MLGAAGVAAVLPPATFIEAKQSASKKAKKKCKRQVAQCSAAWAEICEDNTACFEEFSACCSHLSTCNVSAYLTCFFAVEP
jgi:hypothetical protein